MDPSEVPLADMSLTEAPRRSRRRLPKTADQSGIPQLILAMMASATALGGVLVSKFKKED